MLAVSISAAATAATIGGPARVDERAVRLDEHHRALLVSDSAWLGLKTYGAVDSVQGFEHMLDLASCRRRVTRSCTNYDGHVPIPLIDEVAWRRSAYDTLIVATGYNDSDRNFPDDVDAIVALTRAHGYERIVWLTLRSNVSYTSPGDAGYDDVFVRSNEMLRSLVDSGRYPEIVVADWATYARDRPEWFSGDGIHLRRAGPWAAGDYLSRKMAHLDARACPQPIRAGWAVQNPCPDPDVTGPVVDLASVYPLDDRCAREPFQLEWEGRSTWPDPPCWSR